MKSATSTHEAERRLRVLQVITQLGLGGAERVALGLVRELRDRIDFGVFTVDRTPRGAVGRSMQASLIALNVPWFPGTRLPVKSGGMLTGGAALARAVASFQPDIIHYHTEIPEACGAMLVIFRGARSGPALVRTIHNSIYWRDWPAIGAWCDRRLDAASIACVSRAALAEFERHRRASGARPTTPVVIPNGVSLPASPPRGAPLNGSRRRVLFAGRFTEQKGTDLLARALSLVRLPAGVSAELTLLGEGPHETLLRAIAAHPPAGWQVTVRPPVADLPPLFPEFDLLVVPSRFEGLPLVAIEAALAGLPVVASRAPGLDEVLPAGQPWRPAAGDAGDLAAELTRALAETDRWGPAVARAQAFVLEHFAPAAMNAAYRALYARAART